MNKIRTFRDLVVWQKAIALCLRVYRTSEAFPRNERFGMVSELRMTVRSVAYNIAEGHRRRSTLEYVRFLDIACGSVAKLETQIVLARELEYLDRTVSNLLLSDLAEVERMLAALMRCLRQRIQSCDGRPSGSKLSLDPSAP
jgi:four helix bundle protein